mgnify:FL=1
MKLYYYFVKIIKKTLYNIKFYNEPTFLLGRWCHINIPKCNNDIILRKIDFANSDNNLS